MMHISKEESDRCSNTNVNIEPKSRLSSNTSHDNSKLTGVSLTTASLLFETIKNDWPQLKASYEEMYDERSV